MFGLVDNRLILFRKLVILVAYASLRAAVAVAGATCNKDQIIACRTAARNGQLSDYAGSGQCVVKPYVQYTHLCTVSDYEPSVDHCCCPIASDRVMCCRYHQNWYHFRCTESDDAIDLSSSESCRLTMTSWQVLVPIIVLFTLVVMAFCAICYCWRQKIAARRRSIRPETSHAFSATAESDCFTNFLHCCKWNNVDEKTTAHPVNSTSSALTGRPRTMPPSGNPSPIYSTSIEPSAPPFICGLSSSDTATMSFNEMGLDCVPYVACSHRCRTCFRCTSSLAINDLVRYSFANTSSCDVNNRTCTCAGMLVHSEGFCSPSGTADDLNAPPSYEISQRLHGEQPTPLCNLD